jgi:HK97 family phage portal protein
MGLFETIARGQKAIPAVPQLLDGEPMQIVSPGRTDTQGQISQRVEPTRTPSTPDGVEVLNDPTLNLLFTRPNPFMLWCDLLELAVVDLLLVGNAYWYKWRTTQEGKPLALYRLAPPYIKIVPGAFGVDKYEYQPPGAREPLELPADSVMHMKLPNPHSPYWGLGLIQGGGRAYDLELALTDSQAHFLENRGDPGIVLQSDRRVPRDVFNKLQMQLRARVNRKTSGELLLLESGLKAQSLSRHAQDALFPELTKMSRDRIMAMFRCSPRLLGIGDEASGADKDVDVRQEFDNYTLKPFLKRLAVNIGAGLLTPWGLEFRFDYQTILPHSVILENASAFAKTPGVKVKEIRKFLEPLGVFEDISTGDKTIDDYVLNMPGTNFDENGKPIAGDAAHADQPLAGEAGRPPLPPGGKALLDNLDQRLSKIQKPQRPQPVDQAARDDGVDAAAAAMIPGIKDAVYILERGLLDHSEGKAFEPKTLTSRVRKSEIWKTFMAALTTAIEQGSMRALSAASIHQAAEGRATDELDYETLAKELVFRHGGVRQITDNLKNEIVQKVSQAVAEGKTRDQVDGIIRESIDFWREHHAETVALTEAVHAYNEGTLAVAEASGFEHVFVEDGRDHDAPCLEADGQVWTIDHAREHRLEHPRCRRAFTPYTVPV